MKENKLTIKISKSVSEVFGYTITPPNAKFWVPGTLDEKTSDWPVKLGTIYQEQMQGGEWLNYTVTVFKENEVFELTSQDGNYHARYTYKPLGPNSCELGYYEWVEEGGINEPFSPAVLDNLKTQLESSNL